MLSSQTYEEKELLLRLSNDDGEAFRRLLGDFHQICYRIAVDLIRNEHVAEDIVQEAFLKVWLRRKKMAEVENFGAWLRTVTVNLVYDHITKAKKEKTKAEKWLEGLELSGSLQELPAREETEFETLLQEAIKILSPRQQQTFDLIKRQGYSREEAAALLHLSPETVKYHLELAMKTIRAYCIKRIDPASALVIFSIVFKKYF